MAKRWALMLPSVAIGGCLLTGCGEKTTPEQFGQYLQTVADFARQNDIAGSVDVTIAGDGNVYQKVEFGLDTGIRVEAHLIFNASDEELPKPAATEPEAP